ncbi:MAG: Asp-tRNA(Asn)/Glu-tRNA(Gln) amidotransferase subunit GatB [bacterium]
MEFEPVIGLEVHAQLKTNSKIFCSCSTHFGEDPNSNICPVCTGQPGVLPVLNKRVVELIVKAGIAAHCSISPHSIFARKHYFYPDLPKNYQISQYEAPVCENGYLNIKINDKTKKIGITRIHLEEDAGKLLHMIGSRVIEGSLVDFNRTGIPLIEIVSEPDINFPEECYEYLISLKQILEYMEISDCNMEEGKLRCDANISLRKKGDKKLGVKTELKNMNSFKAVKEAVFYEIERQREILSAGGTIVQETRLWSSDRKITETMRTKEEAHDYHYFPEPDLIPLELKEDFIKNVKLTIGELPKDKSDRFVKELGLSEYDAGVLTANRNIAAFFEKTLNHLDSENFALNEKAKMASNYLTSEILGRLNKAKLEISTSPINPENLAHLIGYLLRGDISNKIAKSVLDELFTTSKSVKEIIKEKGLKQITDSKILEKYILEAIQDNPQAVQQYLEGKEKALGALVGHIMKKTNGQANPQLINNLLKEKIRQ